MTYEIGQQVETPLGVGVIFAIQDKILEEDTNEHYYKVEFPKTKINFLATFVEGELKPYKTPHERLLEMGFEMVLDDEHFTIFEHQELDYTIRVDKIWKGIGIHHYNDDPNYRYIYLKLSRILTEYLEWLEEEK